MRISPHLTFNGQCRAAFERYQSILGGTLKAMLTYGESPIGAEFDARLKDYILHASLAFGDAQELMGTDQLPEGYEPPQGILITLNVAQVDEGRRIFERLAEGGVVRLPFQAVFWSPGFGVAVDAFGIAWEVNCAAATDSD